MLELARMRYFEEDFESAYTLSLQALEKGATLQELELAALSALKLKRQESLHLCAQCLSYHKDSAFWTLCYAKTLLAFNECSVAIPLLESLATRQTSLHKECLTLLLEAYKKGRNIEKCDSIYRTLLQNDPTNWNLYLEFASLYENNTPKKALEILNTVQEMLLQSPPPRTLKIYQIT